MLNEARRGCYAIPIVLMLSKVETSGSGWLELYATGPAWTNPTKSDQTQPGLSGTRTQDRTLDRDRDRTQDPIYWNYRLDLQLFPL